MEQFKTSISYRGELWHATVLDEKRVPIEHNGKSYVFVKDVDAPRYFRMTGPNKQVRLGGRMANGRYYQGKTCHALAFVGMHALIEAKKAAGVQS